MKAREISGGLSASGLRFTLVVSRFNSFVTERLLDGALAALARAGANEDALSVVRVPGAWELPFAAQKAMAATPRPDAVIVLGCVIRGGTPHFEYVSMGATNGCMQAQLTGGVPVSFGLLTCDDERQATERAGAVPDELTIREHAPSGASAPAGHGNKGFEAAIAAIEMANLAKGLGRA